MRPGQERPPPEQLPGRRGAARMSTRGRPSPKPWNHRSRPRPRRCQKATAPTRPCTRTATLCAESSAHYNRHSRSCQNIRNAFYDAALSIPKNRSSFERRRRLQTPRPKGNKISHSRLQTRQKIRRTRWAPLRVGPNICRMNQQYLENGALSKQCKRTFCKTIIRGFESRSHLQFAVNEEGPGGSRGLPFFSGNAS